MKTLKFRIPNTVASIVALITALEYEAALINDSDIATTTGAEQDNTVIDLKPTPPAPEGVDLDEVGLPWDARIHSANKKKLARGNTWKLKRGVEPALVDTVMNELRTTMAAIGVPLADDPEKIDYVAESAEIEKQAVAESTIAPPPAPAPKPEVLADPIYIVEGNGEFTADALLASGWTDEQIATLQVKPVEAVVKLMNFPELMAAITAAGLDESVVLTAVQNQGIQATPLLAARPDLVPAVYAELFPA